MKNYMAIETGIVDTETDWVEEFGVEILTELIEVVKINGDWVEEDVAGNLADDEILEDLHGKIEDAQEFWDLYCERHELKFGESFTI